MIQSGNSIRTDFLTQVCLVALCNLTSVAPTETERVRALADISCLALCCHSNKTHAPIGNLPNNAQLDVTPNILASYIWVHAVVRECGEGQTDTQTAVTNIYISPRLRLT